MNYFQLFDLPISFDIDMAELTQKWHALQQATHPDRHANESEQEILRVVQKNAQINDAYQTLKSPLSRAEYLLSLQGIELQHEQQTIQDPLFLMQQMEWREAIEDIEHHDEPLEQLEMIEARLRGEVKEMLAELALTVESQEQAQLTKAANWIRKLKFMYRLLEQIEQLEEKYEEF